jgi:hypothetical protein
MKIIEILNKIFAPRITKTIYYNDRKVGKLPKEAKEKFKEMNERFNEMNKIFENL